MYISKPAAYCYTKTNWTLVLWNMSTLIAICTSCHRLTHIWSLLLLLLWNWWWFQIRYCLWWFCHWGCSLTIFDAITTLLLLETSCCKVTIVLLSMLRDKLLIVEVMRVGQLSLRLMLSCLLLLLLLLVVLEKRAYTSLSSCCCMCLLHNVCKLMSHHIWNMVQTWHAIWYFCDT